MPPSAKESKYAIYTDAAQVKVFAANELSERCRAPWRDGEHLASIIRTNNNSNSVPATPTTTATPLKGVAAPLTPPLVLKHPSVLNGTERKKQQDKIDEYRQFGTTPYLVKEPPTVGVVLSGGGWRSMEASTNFMDTLRLSGVLSHVSVVAGLSGGSWTCVLGGMSGEKNYLYGGGEQQWTKGQTSDGRGADVITSSLYTLMNGDDATKTMLNSLKTMLSPARAEQAARVPFGEGKPNPIDHFKDALSSVGRVAAKVAFDEHLPHLMALLSTNPRQSYLYNYSRILDAQFYGPPGERKSEDGTVCDVEFRQDKQSKLPLMVVAAASFARYSEHVHIHDWFEFDGITKTIHKPHKDKFEVVRKEVPGGGLRECTQDGRRKNLPDLKIRFSQFGFPDTSHDEFINAPIVMAISGCALPDTARKKLKVLRFDKDYFTGHIYDYTRQHKQHNQQEIAKRKREANTRCIACSQHNPSLDDEHEDIGARPLPPPKPVARLYDPGISCNVPLQLAQGRCNIAFVLDNSYDEKASEELAMAVCKGYYHIHVPGEEIAPTEIDPVEERSSSNKIWMKMKFMKDQREELFKAHAAHNPVEAAFLRNHVNKWMTKDGKQESTDVVRIFLPKRGYSKAVWGENGGSRKDDEPILIYLRGLRTESTFRMDRTPEEIDENHKYMTHLTAVAVKALEFIIKQENIIPAAGYWAQSDFFVPDSPFYDTTIALPLAPSRTLAGRVFSFFSTFAPFRLIYNLLHLQMEKLTVRSRKLGATVSPPSTLTASTAMNQFMYATTRSPGEGNPIDSSHTSQGRRPPSASLRTSQQPAASPSAYTIAPASPSAPSPTLSPGSRFGVCCRHTGSSPSKGTKKNLSSKGQTDTANMADNYWNDPSYTLCVEALFWVLGTLRALQNSEIVELLRDDDGLDISTLDHLNTSVFDIPDLRRVADMVDFPEKYQHQEGLMQFKCLAASLLADEDLLQEFGHLTALLRAVIRDHRPKDPHPEEPNLYAKLDEIVAWAGSYENELRSKGGTVDDDVNDVEGRTARQQQLRETVNSTMSQQWKDFHYGEEFQLNRRQYQHAADTAVNAFARIHNCTDDGGGDNETSSCYSDEDTNNYDHDGDDTMDSDSYDVEPPAPTTIVIRSPRQRMHAKYNNNNNATSHMLTSSAASSSSPAYNNRQSTMSPTPLPASQSDEEGTTGSPIRRRGDNSSTGTLTPASSPTARSTR